MGARRVLHAERAQRLLFGIMVATWCAVLLGEAAIRAGDIPACGRRQHAVSLVRRGLDWLAVPPKPWFFRACSLQQKLSGSERGRPTG
jgi:hypothetical protein